VTTTVAEDALARGFEALAAGKAVVSTARGAEGLLVRDVTRKRGCSKHTSRTHEPGHEDHDRERDVGDQQGQEGGETGVDHGIAEQGFAGIGAWILGRNMFGPVRGPWPDESWQGWWGDEPPYHTPVFVLTHHPRPPLRMKGGTEFRFVTEGIHAALQQASAAAGGRDVRLGGGVATVRQYLQARLVDELHLAVSSALLGSGEHLWQGLDLPELGYAREKTVAGERATHVFLRRRA